MGKTHLAAGICLGLPLISLNDPISALGIIGSIFPDFDLAVPGLIKHRTLTHSLLCMVGTTLLIEHLSFSAGLALVWLVCYTSHLALDSFTVRGVPIVWPISKNKIGLKLFTTGKKADVCLQYLFHFGTALYLLDKLKIFLK